MSFGVPCLSNTVPPIEGDSEFQTMDYCYKTVSLIPLCKIDIADLFGPAVNELTPPVHRQLMSAPQTSISQSWLPQQKWTTSIRGGWLLFASRGTERCRIKAESHDERFPSLDVILKGSQALEWLRTNAACHCMTYGTICRPLHPLWHLFMRLCISTRKWHQQSD